MKDIVIQVTRTKDTIIMSVEDWEKFLNKLKKECHYTITEETDEK